MTPEFIEQVQDAMALLKASGIKLRGDRVAVMIDTPKDTYGDTGIIKPDTYKAKTLIGVVVAHGTKVSPEDRDELPLGHMTTFNRMGTIADHIRLNGKEYDFYQIHTLDTLWSIPSDIEVESCAE